MFILMWLFPPKPGLIGYYTSPEDGNQEKFEHKSSIPKIIEMMLKYGVHFSPSRVKTLKTPIVNRKTIKGII